MLSLKTPRHPESVDSSHMARLLLCSLKISEMNSSWLLPVYRFSRRTPWRNFVPATLFGIAAYSFLPSAPSNLLPHDRDAMSIVRDSGPGTSPAGQRSQAALVDNPTDLLSCEAYQSEYMKNGDPRREPTVIGTVVNEHIDQNMGESDRACIRTLLDHWDDERTAAWRSAEADVSYKVVTTRTFRSGGGLLCREFSAASARGDVTLGNAHRVACRQLSGDWLIRK